MGFLTPSKFGLVLRANAPASAISDALLKAATVEPSFGQRKLKYRKALGIGTGDVSRIDPAVVADEHDLSAPPLEAIEVDLGPIVLRAWISSVGTGAEARYICINDPQGGFAWAKALTERTGEFLAQAGISDFEIEVLKARG